jgi:S1-C subfamily serine protease
MEHLSFIHLSGPRRGEVDAVETIPATLGSDPSAQVIVPGTAPQHARLVQRADDIVLQDGDSEGGTFLYGEAIREAPLRDGDIIELGSGGPRLRFRHEGEKRISLIRALRWARPEGAPRGLEDTAAFLRAVLREVSARTSRAFRLALVLSLVAAAGLLIWSLAVSRRLQRQLASVQDSLRNSEEERKAFQVRIEEERQRAEAERKALTRRTEDFRQRGEELSRRLADAATGEVVTLKEELKLTRGRLETLETERAAGERIIRDYGSGVCLIQGSYAFYDSSDRPLKLAVADDGQPLRDADGSLNLDVDAKGPVHTLEHLGTGFLVERGGLILTNRHVAEPWWNDAEAEALAGAGFRPRFVFFRAFFPRLKEPFDLRVEKRSDKFDLALLRTNVSGRKVPVLPLDLSEAGAVAGQPVVVVGYPTGLEAILAKADTKVVQEVLAAAGTRSDQVTEALSQRGLIRPSTTQGHIGDVTKSDIVFDAPTTQGGSGGPIFNKNGQVIAVEYAVLQKFGGNAFGIPIRHALELLRVPKARASSD